MPASVPAQKVRGKGHLPRRGSAGPLTQFLGAGQIGAAPGTCFSLINPAASSASARSSARRLVLRSAKYRLTHDQATSGIHLGVVRACRASTLSIPPHIADGLSSILLWRRGSRFGRVWLVPAHVALVNGPGIVFRVPLSSARVPFLVEALGSLIFSAIRRQLPLVHQSVPTGRG